MFASQGPGGIYYSAVQQEPEMHPLIEMGASLAPYVTLGMGANYLAKLKYKNSKEITAYDVALTKTRNLLNKGLGGFFNTFRIAEMGSFNLSGEALGLNLKQSVLDPSKQVRQQVFGSEYFNKNTNKLLKEILGESDYEKISAHLIGGQDNFELIYEMGTEDKRKGNLIFRELQSEFVDTVDSTGKPIKQKVYKPKTGTERLISQNVALQYGVSGADTLDLLEGGDFQGRINPITQGVYQNLVSGEDVNFKEVFKSSISGQQSRVMLVPSVSGSLDNVGDLKRRTSVLTGHLSAGIDRFNRLIDATTNQIPMFNQIKEKLFGDQDFGLSLKTTPDAFYKQFFSIGLKASKIGGAYMGLQTIDHYREQFGFLGNVVASSAVSGGLALAYTKIAKKADTAFATKLGLGSLAIQLAMPGFDKGVVEGLATTAVNVDIGRSYIGQFTGLSYVRRGIEGILPGFTEPEMGIALGLGVAGLSYSEYPKRFAERLASGRLHTGDKIFQSIDNFLSPKFGALVGESYSPPASKKDIISQNLIDILYPGKDPATKEYSEKFISKNPLAQTLMGMDETNPLFKEYKTKIDDILQGKGFDELDKDQIKNLKSFFKDNKDLIKQMIPGIDAGQLELKVDDFDDTLKNIERSEVYKAYTQNNEINASLLKRINYINNKYSSGEGVLNNISRRIEIFGAEMYHSFYGASMTGEVDVDIDGIETKTKLADGTFKNLDYETVAKSLKASPIMKRLGTLTLGTAFLHQMVTSGFFGMMENPDELKEIYSGEKLVEVKKGRWWEAGATPYEGGETRYFRPHAYVQMMTKAKDRSVWGDEVDEYNPLTRFLLKNFTYHLERKNYYDRPYPITGAAFEDVPVLGGILSATIGRVIKPTKLMHEEELRRVGAGGINEIAYQTEYGSSPELGQIPPGVPTSPYGTMASLGKIQYQFRELEGLTGYGKNVLQKMFTGREILGTRQYIMANSNMMSSTIRDFWDQDLGGFAFMSEPIRRLLPRPRAEIETYNPIMNSMPSYLPDKFKQGDPYRLIDNGAVRLPGKGYEAVNPDVAGMDPEDYPLIHKYKIMADVAPQSRVTMKMREELLEREVAEILTNREKEMLAKISEYHYKRLAATRDETFHENAIKIPVLSSLIGETYAGATSLMRKTAAAAENLMPGGFRPLSKLTGHTRDAIEVYEMERLYNTSNSFWDAPIRDWFRPAMYSAAHAMGWDGKPIHVQKREALDEHFDKLQFMKFMALADQASNAKDRKRYLGLAARTRTGVNPNGDALSLYLSLPSAEKRFFDAFANARESDRQRILEMVPDDQKALYKTVWSRIDAGQESEMLASSKPIINEQHMYSQLAKVREEMKMMPMPEADWIGWHKDVDINDIKVKYVDNLGAEIHDYDMWESQVRKVSRRPYLEGSDLFLYKGRGFNRNSARQEFLRGFDNYSELNSGKILLNSSGDFFENSRAEIYYKDSREAEILNMMSTAIRG